MSHFHQEILLFADVEEQLMKEEEDETTECEYLGARTSVQFVFRLELDVSKALDISAELDYVPFNHLLRVVWDLL